MRDDWSIADDAGVALTGARVLAGVHGRFAYLFVAVRDADVVYRRQLGTAAFGDRIVLAIEPTPGAVRWLLLATSAPGTFRAQETHRNVSSPSDNYDDRVVGAWQATASGYEVEVRIPLALVGARLGVGVIGVDRAGADYSVALAATWDAASRAPGRFVYQRPELGALLAPFGRAGGRFRVLDPDGWVLADAGRRRGPCCRSRARQRALRPVAIRVAARRSAVSAERPPGRIAAAPALRALAGGSATAWYGRAGARDAIVAAAVPIAGAHGATAPCCSSSRAIRS